MKKAKSKSNQTAQLSKAQIRLFRVIMVLIPVLALLFLELGLRIFHYGSNRDLFELKQWKGRRIYNINPGVVKRYFQQPGFSTYTSRDVFEYEKSPDTYRVFCLGASTTVGFPYLFNGSFSSLLKDRLEMIMPRRKIEMVNLGITAVNSFTVADLTREVMDYQPDLLIIYMGQNEIYGAFGVGSTQFGFTSPVLKEIYLSLSHFKTFQLLSDALTRIQSLWTGGSGSDRNKTLMEQMVKNREIKYMGKEYRQALRYFTDNLKEIIQTAKSHGVDVLISNLVCNLSEQRPFVSLFSETLDSSQIIAYKEKVSEAREFIREEKYVEAMAVCEGLLKIDENFAETHFLLGKCSENLGDIARAKNEYQLACDLDGLPFRAGSPFNHLIDSLTSEMQVPMIDMMRAFEDASPQGLLGDELFWEHVHPNFQGYFLMAKSICDLLENEHEEFSVSQFMTNELQSDDYLASISGVTEFDHETAWLRIEKLKHSWPFPKKKRPFSYEPKNIVQEVAWDYARGNLSWAAAHINLAKYYVENQNLEEAEMEYIALAKQSFYNPSPWLTVAKIQSLQKKYGAAVGSYQRALKLEETAELRVKTGIACFQMQDYPSAIVHFETALKLIKSTREQFSGPQQVKLAFLLGEALLKTGRIAEARLQYEFLNSIAPESVEKERLQKDLSKAGG